MFELKDLVQSIEEELIELDANRNRYISRGEFQNLALPDPYIAFIQGEMMKRADSVGDLEKCAELSELTDSTEILNNFFDTLDSDHDGYISFDEVKNFS